MATSGHEDAMDRNEQVEHKLADGINGIISGALGRLWEENEVNESQERRERTYKEERRKRVYKKKTNKGFRSSKDHIGSHRVAEISDLD